MSLQDTELKIGGVNFKGVYVAVVLSVATSIAGIIWTASTLYSRLEAVENRTIPDVKPMQEELQLIKQQLQDNEIGALSAKLATLGANIATIMDQQEKLLELKSELSTLSKEIEAMKGTVAAAEVITKDNEDIAERIKILTKEAEDLWEAVQYLSNPYR